MSSVREDLGYSNVVLPLPNRRERMAEIRREIWEKKEITSDQKGDDDGLLQSEI